MDRNHKQSYKLCRKQNVSERLKSVITNTAQSRNLFCLKQSYCMQYVRSSYRSWYSALDVCRVDW